MYFKLFNLIDTKTLTKRNELNRLLNNWNRAIRSALKIVKHWGFTAYTKSHKHVYRVLRNNYNLPSQVAIEANRKAIASYKTSKPKFRDKTEFNHQSPVSLVKDETFKFIRKDNGTNLVKINIEPYNNIYIPICVSEYHLNYLNNDRYELKTAELYKQNSNWYLNFIMRYKNKRKSKAHSSDSRKTSLIKENQLTKQTNWLIANRIIEIAKEYNSTIIFEDLKNIRTDISNDNSLSNYEKNSWSYYQLKQFVKHKANLNNLPVKEVNPANTSQICSECGSKGFRLTQDLFKCTYGHKFNADSNASINIAKRYIKDNNQKSVA